MRGIFIGRQYGSGSPLRFAAIIFLGVAYTGMFLGSVANAQIVEGEFQVPAEAFDQWVFQKVGTIRVARAHLTDLLEQRVAAVDAACNLADAQRRKLMLAGRLDIRELFDRVEAIREEFLAVRRDQEAFNEARIWQRTAPLQAAIIGGVFDAHSLYQKVLASTLDDDQWSAWEQVEQQRRQYAYEAKIRLTFAAMDATLPLSHGQREALITLLLERTPAPLRIGNYEQYYVLYQCGQLGLRDLARLLTPAQLRRLRTRVNDFPEAQRTFLREQGLLSEAQETSVGDRAEAPLAAADDEDIRQAVEQIAAEGVAP